MITPSFTVHREPYRIAFELPGLPKTTNAARSKGHWHRLSDDRKWKSAVALIVGKHRPERPLERYRLNLTRYSSVEPDFDGLVSSFKVIVDGLRECGVIADDRMSNTGAWNCQWGKVPAKQGRIRVSVEELET